MSEDKAVLIKTAYSYYQKGDWERAIEEYHKLADLDPKDLNVHNMLADIYAKKGDVQEALQQYDLVAQGFDQKNQVDKVLQVYKRMLKLVPNDPELLSAVKNLIEKYLTKAAQLEETELDKALEIYKSVLKAEPHRLDANLLYAKLLVKKGQKFEGVEALMNLVLNLDPETQTGKLVEVLQTVTELDPLNIEAREKLIGLFITAKQAGPAVKSLHDLIEIYISKNDFEKAEAAAQKAIEFGDLNTFYHLGVIFFNQQKYEEAYKAFEKFLKQQEGHVGALKYLALSYLRLNQNSKAVQVYLKILDVYFNENLLDESREVRQTILELDPNNDLVGKYPLDQQVSAIEELPEPTNSIAGATSEEAAQLETEEQQTLLSQAQTFTERGFYEQAIDVYLEMLKRWPDFADIRVRLQQVYALIARAMEPVEKYPSPEEIKSELERELREQMRRELEEQAKVVQERQKELEQKTELDQMRLKQELETKLLEQVQRSSKDDELRQKLISEFEEKQKLMLREREKIEQERNESLLLAQANRSTEDELRRQIAREFEEKQRLLSIERESLEKEKSESFKRLKEELEETKISLEQKIREQVEREIKDKLERDGQREIQLQEALRQEEKKRQREEDERKQYASQKRELEAAKAKINQEILQGMERLRVEKEKEVKKQTVNGPADNSGSAINPIMLETQESLDDPFVRQTLAEIYAKQGLYVEALKIYEKILNEEPNNEDVREKLRDILRLKGI